jgi:uncharacterized protein (DUF58 family)
MRRGSESGAGAAGNLGRGAGFELAGFRPYVQGDDPRTLDWNALARLGQPIVRSFRDAEPGELCIVVDRSESMDFGAPTKSDTALRIAGAAGILAMAAGARAQLWGDPARPENPQSWLSLLEASRRRPTQQFRGAFPLPRPRASREWLLLTDYYELDAAARFLVFARRNQNPSTVVLLSSEADREAPAGAVVAVDGETHSRRPFTAAERDRFAAKKAAALDSWSSLARKFGAGLVEAHTEKPWEVAVAAFLESRAVAS